MPGRAHLGGRPARAADPEGGADPRLRRRLGPLIPAAAEHGCRIISNQGAANPAAAARATAALAGELGRSGLRVAAVLGDDVAHLASKTDPSTTFASRGRLSESRHS
jgi:acyclic terpene utilization AtuA family protein